MMDDFDELRVVLRERAALAPKTDDLITVTRRRARCRQVRRRGIGLGGVVVLTALALVGAGLLSRTHQQVMPAGGQLVQPAFPFTVGALPDGLEPAGWESIGDAMAVRPFASHQLGFVGPHDQLGVAWVNRDPSSSMVDRAGAVISGPSFTVHGVTATVKQGTTAGHYWDISWPVGPSAWIEVIANGGNNGQAGWTDMVTIANAITATPSTPPATLAIPHLPLGFAPFSWRHYVPPGQIGPAQDEVELCPQVTSSAGCFQVIAGHGDVAHATTSSGAAITRGHQIDTTHWVGVYPAQVPGIDAAELNGLLAETSVG